jgi:hypothetical protein
MMRTCEIMSQWMRLEHYIATATRQVAYICLPIVVERNINQECLGIISLLSAYDVKPWTKLTRELFTVDC